MLKLKPSIHNMALLFFALNINTAFSANSLTLDMSGEIIEKGCNLDSDDIAVSIPDISKNKLDSSKETEFSEFKILLSSCNSSFFNIKFSAANTVVVNNEKYIETTGNTGVLLSIYDKNKTRLKLDEKITGVVSPELIFYVKGTSNDNKDINPGIYSGLASFSINYN